MIKFDSRKVTPNQFAKIMVSDLGASAFYWHKKIDEEVLADMTKREVDEINKRIEYQYIRVREYLNINKIIE